MSLKGVNSLAELNEYISVNLEPKVAQTPVAVEVFHEILSANSLSSEDMQRAIITFGMGVADKVAVQYSGGHISEEQKVRFFFCFETFPLFSVVVSTLPSA